MTFTFHATQSPTDTIAYAVKPGDTLSGIIHHYYGHVSHTQRQDLIRSIQAANPSIKNPNHIIPGQLIKLEVPVQHCRIPSPYERLLYGYGQEDWFSPMERNWATATPEDRSLQVALAKLMLGTGSANLMAIDRTFKSSTPLLIDMVENYENYKRGGASKGQYDYRRRQKVDEFTRRLGPMNFLLNGTQSPNEVLRISRTSGTAPTQPVTHQINKMQRISKTAARGGVVLSVVGLGVACYEIAQTDDADKKNDILVESLGSVLGGIAYGAAVGLTLFLLATPVGWVGALAIAAGGAAFSYGAGQVAGSLYDATGRKIDFAHQTGINTICAGGTNKLKPAAPRISSAALSFL